jgi:hypothetical protein
MEAENLDKVPIAFAKRVVDHYVYISDPHGFARQPLAETTYNRQVLCHPQDSRRRLECPQDIELILMQCQD